MTAKDCRLDTFRAGGKGGQNQNTRDTGVRFTHPPSGAVGEARDGRKQHENKRKAFVRMAQSKEFQSWAKREASSTNLIEPIYVNIRDWDQKIAGLKE